MLRRDVDLLSLDVFGVALRRMVLEPDDIHRLVGAMVGDDDEVLIGRYPDLRLEAERLARIQKGAGVGVADIADRLEELLDESDTADGAEVARQAIKYELDVERLIASPDPEALELYNEAVERGIQVAFVADSYLPRDLVAKMLSASRYRPRDVLVSSHEGAVNSDGLLGRMLERTGATAGRVVHVGPDLQADADRAASTGVRNWIAPSARKPIEDRLVLGLTERTGLDSIGLALAADRMAEFGPELDPAGVGYVAGGPLVCGFATWIVRMIAAEDPDHVVFYGPTVGFLHRLTVALRPELAGARLHRFNPSRLPPNDLAPGPATLSDQLELFGTAIGIEDGQRVLAIDLGWNRRDDNGLAAAWDLLARRVDVNHAFLGLFEHQHDPARTRTWAFGPDSDDPVRPVARECIEILEALVGYEPPIGPTPLAGLDGAIREQFETGVRRYAEDFQPWLRLGRYRTSAAMAEPALRVLLRPGQSEARMFADVPSRVLDAHGQARPLLPSTSSRAPESEEEAADDPASKAVWTQGFDALEADAGRQPSPRISRRLGRRG